MNVEQRPKIHNAISPTSLTLLLQFPMSAFIFLHFCKCVLSFHFSCFLRAIILQWRQPLISCLLFPALHILPFTERLKLSQDDLCDNIFPSHFTNRTFNSSLFSFGDVINNDLTLFYECSTTTADMSREPVNLFGSNL